MKRIKNNTVYKTENFLTGDKFSFAFLTAAFGMLLVYSFIQNPADYTISLIGTQHPTLFFIVCAIMSAATAVNMIQFEKSSGLNGKFWVFATYFINAAMTAASVTQTEEYVKYLTEFHWVCALLFMAVNPIIILICSVKRIKNGQRKYIKAFRVFMPIYFYDLIYILRSFVFFGVSDGKNGIMEIIPIFTTLILLFLFNHTKIYD